MKGSHPRPADRCPFVLRHSIGQVTSFMQLGMLCIQYDKKACQILLRLWGHISHSDVQPKGEKGLKNMRFHYTMAMTLCKTVASPMHTYLIYHSLALSHRWRNRWDFAITWLTKTCLIVLVQQIPWRTTTLGTYWGVLAASIAASIVDTTSRCMENIASIKHLYGLFYYPRLAKPMWGSLKHG